MEWPSLCWEAPILPGPFTITRAQLLHSYQLLHEAYDFYLLEGGPQDYNEWVLDQQDKQPQFFFWYKTLELMLLVLAHVRASLAGNLTLYMDTMHEVIVWVFGTDQLHYEHNLPVHFRDLLAMKTLHPDI